MGCFTNRGKSTGVVEIVLSVCHDIEKRVRRSFEIASLVFGMWVWFFCSCQPSSMRVQELVRLGEKGEV